MTHSGTDDEPTTDQTAVEVDLDDHSFALCLTHDVDRVYKTYQSVAEVLLDGDLGSLRDLLPGRNPYWQFETIMEIEDEFGVRSAFYFLDEQYLFRDRPVRTWIRPGAWKLYLGRYSLSDPDVVGAIHDLDEGGWEVGLHGSYESYRDGDRLRAEKESLEAVLGHEVLGGRQHYLNLDRPDTWRRQADAGLKYDATLGSTDDYGFQGRYQPFRPFEDEFVVFPLTLMELTLPAVETDPERAWQECEALLQEARENEAVMTVLWHPSYFSERDHPNFALLYRHLIERALDMGAWVGSPGELYADLDHPDPPCEDDTATRSDDGVDGTVEGERPAPRRV